MVLNSPRQDIQLQVKACAQLGEPVTGSLKGLEGNDCLACLCPQSLCELKEETVPRGKCWLLCAAVRGFITGRL